MRLDPGIFFGNRVRQCRAAGLSLVVSTYRAGQKLPPHVHENPTFFLLIAGEHRERWRRQDHLQPELTLVFHPTNEPHEAQVGPGGMIGLNIEFDKTWLAQRALLESDLGSWQMLESVWWRLRSLRLLATAAGVGAPEATCFETQLLELLEPLVQWPASESTTARPDWLRRAEEMIHDEFRHTLRLCALAQDIGVHPIHLARVFRKYHHCSVSEYIRALRLAEAGQLILRRQCSLADAAFEAGFCDQAHLCRWFAREFGFTPKNLSSVRRFLQI
ncbi:MAG TPA: AraC family transcriptional regulator [Gemmataceae bacterium]|nr:AraC family transcriptional regulator [Gemmataceae bacterium]